jgi:hypothetical protein
MHTPDVNSIKQAFNKWLIALALLASVFAFSGLSTSPQAGSSPVQSTWIIRGGKLTISGIRFSRLKQNFTNCSNKSHATLCVTSLSQLRSKLDATRLKQCRGYSLSNTNKILFSLNKTIPQNGKAEPSPVLA